MNAVAGDAQHAALASSVRREILALLRECGEWLNAATIAERVGLHITTIRFHLDQLESAKLVRRHVERGGHRGRPPVVYAAEPAIPAREADHQFATALVAVLAHDADGGRARSIDAGEAWGRSLAKSIADSAGAEDRLMSVLDSIGFETSENDSTGAIQVRACPFRDIAAEHPQVVCSVHLGLMQGALGAEKTSAVSLDPFVEPDLCVAHVRSGTADENPGAA